MDLANFKKSIIQNEPPLEVNNMLKALWYDAKGNWDTAHNIIQKEEGVFSYDRIHAYLHRKEGDMFNAKWWYKRLKVEFPKVTLSEEWDELVKSNL